MLIHRWLVCGRATAWGLAHRDDVPGLGWLRRRDDLPGWMYYV